MRGELLCAHIVPVSALSPQPETLHIGAFARLAR